MLVFGLSAAVQAGPAETRPTVVWDASNPLNLKWQIVNDTVMGGVSDSRLVVTDAIARFSGNLSLENNGGFASVRTLAAKLDLPPEAGKFVIRIRGDGRTYKLTARRNGSFDGVNYQNEFPTIAGEWQELELSLADFRASWRGRALPEEPSLKAPDIQSIGLIIADKKDGRFQLEIEWIKLSP